MTVGGFVNQLIKKFWPKQRIYFFEEKMLFSHDISQVCTFDVYKSCSMRKAVLRNMRTTGAHALREISTILFTTKIVLYCLTKFNV